MLTGSQLRVLVDVDVYGPCIFMEDALRTAAAELYRSDLLDVDKDNGYRLTPKGRVFMEMIRATPMPVQSWKDPRS